MSDNLKTESNMMDKVYDMTKRFFKRMWLEFKASIRKVTIDGIGWTALLTLHAVTIPTFIGLMTGLSDKTPPIDMVLILWVGLGLFYFKSILEKNIVSIIIIGLGFIAQSILMALVFFK